MAFTAPFVSGCATEYMGNLISLNTAYVIVYVFLTTVAVASVLEIRKVLRVLLIEKKVVDIDLQVVYYS